MLTKKLSLAAVIAASIASTFSLNAGSGFDENENLIISAKKLKAGYESGELTLKSGQKFKVEGSLDPAYLSWDKEKFYGGSLSPNSYNFIKNMGGPTIDPITGDMDLNRPFDGMKAMNLTLTKL